SISNQPDASPGSGSGNGAFTTVPERPESRFSTAPFTDDEPMSIPRHFMCSVPCTRTSGFLTSVNRPQLSFSNQHILNCIGHGVCKQVATFLVVVTEIISIERIGHFREHLRQIEELDSLTPKLLPSLDRSRVCLTHQCRHRLFRSVELFLLFITERLR